MKVLLFFPSWKLGHLPASGFLGLSVFHISCTPSPHLLSICHTPGNKGSQAGSQQFWFLKGVRGVFGLGLEIWTLKGAAACPLAPAFLLPPQNIPDLAVPDAFPQSLCCSLHWGELSGPSEFCLSEAFTEICPSCLRFVILTSDLRLLSFDLFKFWNPQKHPICLGVSDAGLPIPVVVSGLFVFLITWDLRRRGRSWVSGNISALLEGADSKMRECCFQGVVAPPGFTDVGRHKTSSAPAHSFPQTSLSGLAGHVW